MLWHSEHYNFNSSHYNIEHGVYRELRLIYLAIVLYLTLSEGSL